MTTPALRAAGAGNYGEGLPLYAAPLLDAAADEHLTTELATRRGNTLPDLAALARPCRYCKSPAGTACYSPTGRTATHAARYTP